MRTWQAGLRHQHEQACMHDLCIITYGFSAEICCSVCNTLLHILAWCMVGIVYKGMQMGSPTLMHVILICSICKLLLVVRSWHLAVQE